MKAFIIDRYDSSFARKEMLKTEELVTAALCLPIEAQKAPSPSGQTGLQVAAESPSLGGAQ